jgi:putative flippase GtrA
MARKNMKEFIVKFNVTVTLGISLVLLYFIWTERLDDLLWKALASYIVIMVSQYIALKYIEVLKDDSSEKANKS